MAVKTLFGEFKAFILRGNVLDLAVAVIIGVAFNEVVRSLTNDILLVFVAAVFGEPSFNDVTIGIGDGVLRVGSFLTAVINFVLIAAVVFLVVKVAASLMPRKPTPEDEAPIPSDEALILGEIRDLLRAANPPPAGRRRSSAT